MINLFVCRISIICICMLACVRVLTRKIEGERDEAMVFAENPQRLLPLHQREEVIGHRLTVEEVVHTQQEVPNTHVHMHRLM